MPELFYRLPRNAIAIFSGRNLVWHALAIGLTIAIVMSGGDWSYIILRPGTACICGWHGRPSCSAPSFLFLES